MAKMSIIFDGFAKMAAELEAKGRELKPAVNEALEESQKYIQQNLESAAEPYEHGGRKGWAKGAMYKAIIRNPKIEWLGDEASVKVGFTGDNDKAAFMHSIFIMYGVPAHGKFNKGFAKDAKVYNAIYGVKTRREIERIQKEVMEKHLKLGR